MTHRLFDHWTALARALCAKHADVQLGKMMSAEALVFGGKVFAFYSAKGGGTGLGCRLGRGFDIEGLGLRDWQHLAPFKTKPPMQDWIVAGADDLDRWPDLAALSLSLAKERASK